MTDTAAKRAAALNAGQPVPIVLPIPDDEIGEADRAQLAGGYTPQLAIAAEAVRRVFYLRAVPASDQYRFDDVIKDPGETFLVALNFYDMAAIKWAPNEQFSQGEFVRPRIPNGFAYEKTSASTGTTAAREPFWPKTIGATVPDGSCTWTCRAASTNALSAISEPAGASDPTGVTVSNVEVGERCKILAAYVGGSEGSIYDAVFNFTLDGVARIARQRIIVAKQ